MTNNNHFHFKILIVEDDLLFRTYVKNIIKSLGYDCIEAENGKKGLEQFMAEKPHLIISDIQMPGMSGIEMLQKIREMKSEVIFVVMTFFDSEEWAIKALNAGANNYLKKPINKDKLVHLLKKYYTIAQSRTASRDINNMIVNKEFVLKFKSSIEVVPVIVEYLIKESGIANYMMNTAGIELGLNEIITNSVEHGNLGITYDEKSNALNKGTYEKLYIERLTNNILSEKSVTIKFKTDEKHFEWEITDEGEGFEWKKVPDPIVEDNKEGFHGRGIFLSRFQFDEMEYLGKGNIVKLRKYKKE
ncbi:MAG: response regulator [Bacteroidales bacterium]|nr:response regulator [Bacteroidales bacterium]